MKTLQIKGLLREISLEKIIKRKKLKLNNKKMVLLLTLQKQLKILKKRRIMDLIMKKP
jgi:hypothetical protein